MHRTLLPLLLALAGAAQAAERSPAGTYRLTGEPDVASRLRLGADGRFDYFLVAGALDERVRGRWRSAGRAVTLITEPKPVPPEFSRLAPASTDSAPLTVRVSWPDGSGIALVDLRVGFDSGPPAAGYTQEEGWSLSPEEKRIPRWIELAVPMHGLASPRFPIDLAEGNALAFRLAPNDLGVVDFDGMAVDVEENALIVHRGGARLRYQRARE